VVAAEDERHETVPDDLRHLRGNLPARLEDRGEVACVRVAGVGGLPKRRRDVAAIAAEDLELVDPLSEPRIPDRRRAHVDAPAAAGAEVERCSDDRDAPLLHADTIRSRSLPGRRRYTSPRSAR